MQRPCFALAVLLGWMASTVLVVDRAHSQPLGTAAVLLPGPGSVCGFVAGQPRIVRGQSIEVEENRWCGGFGHAAHVASDDVSMRDTHPSLATEDTRKMVQTVWTLLGTGYDAAYDFAMHHGRYIDVKVEEECADDHALRTLDEPFPYEPNCLLGCDDFDSGFDCTSEAHKSEITGLPVCTWGCEGDVAGIDVASPTPALLSDRSSQWLFGKVHASIARVNASASQYAEAVQGWSPSDLWNAWTAATPVMVSAPVIELGEPTTELADDLADEVLLLTTANTLDQAASTLESAAQCLRTWAADRIAAKMNARRVARNSTRD